MDELSELVSEELESSSDHRVNLRSSDNSINSEPAPSTNVIFDYHPSAILSDTDASFLNSDDGVNNLEFLIDNQDHFADANIVPYNTDLEDLLDDEDKMSIEEDAESLLNTSPKSSRKSSVDNSSTEFLSDDEEISALKAKHEQDMQDLIKHQQKELRIAEQDLLRKKKEKRNTNFETSKKLKDYYSEQEAKGNKEFGDLNFASTLCI